MNNLIINPHKNSWPSVIARPVFDSKPLETTVAAILDDVKQNGDAAVKKYASQFDKISLDTLLVSDEEIREAALLISDELKAAIKVAQHNITSFHLSQQEKTMKVETMSGVVCWRKSVAVQKVGLYIPGGTAPLFSTLLMLGIPASIAGCKDIIVCTPCATDGKVHPAVLYVASLIGCTKVYKIGGVQAIAAMAYGTQTVPQVYKIFGPGNQYVTCAKQMISKDGIAIDMPAGPSEVAVYADDSCNAAFVAADLLSQAEHGADSQVILVASSVAVTAAVEEETKKQLQRLPRKEIAEKALSNSRFIVMDNVADAFELLNAYAPEHLIIASDNADVLCEKVINAGSVFVGHYSPESAGDYASGTNHTLPTNGYAKAYSGVSLDSFVKKISFQQLTEQGLQTIGKTVELMAAAEGLQAHKNAVTIRLNNLL